jgi:hypothetical protein
VYEPGDQSGSWAAVYNQGLWSLIQNPGSIGGTKDYESYLYGINNQDVVVGYHTKHTPYPTFAYLVAPPELWQDIVFPPSIGTVRSSIAYGINDDGDMVGTACVGSSSKDCVNESWYAVCVYSSCPQTSSSKKSFDSSYCWGVLNNGTNTSATTAYAISDSFAITSRGTVTKLIAGSYTDSTNNVTYGFVVPLASGTGTKKCPVTVESFEQVHATSAATLTVVRGVNADGDIAGYYVSNNKQHGFVGTPVSLAKRRR